MKKEIKRKKLTLSVSGGTNRPKKNIEIAKTQTRNYTVIPKKSTRLDPWGHALAAARICCSLATTDNWGKNYLLVPSPWSPVLIDVPGAHSYSSNRCVYCY